MMIRRIILFFVFTSVVSAKLMLWPSAEDINNDTKIFGKKQGSNNIHDRLKLYHGDNSNTVKYYATPNSISPTKYISFMFQYLQQSIYAMSDYLYSSSDPKVSESASAYALFRHAKYKDILSEPKDIWEGIVSAFSAAKTGYFGGMRSIVDGAYELGYGTIYACIALFGGGNSNRNNGMQFLTELAKGLRNGASHTANGLYLFGAGAVVASRNLVVGTFRTPRAMISSKLGMSYYPQGKKQIINQQAVSDRQTQVAVWDYYSLDYEDREIHMEEKRLKEQNIDISQQTEKKKSATRNIRRRARSSVKDKRYYDVLGVEPHANPKEIRSAYRKEALKRHPDKQTPTSYDDNAEEDPHIEGFLDLTEAYRILSNDESRYAYDQYGLCFREETMLPEDGSHEDYIDLVDELFGAHSVQEYVGIVAIAPIVNEMFGFKSEDTGSQQSMEVQNLQQRRRIVDVAMHLRDRVDSFVRGKATTEEFTISCRMEAQSILKNGGEPMFLRIIGKTLLEEADNKLSRFVRKTVSESGQKLKVAQLKVLVYGPVYLKAALSGLVMGRFNDKQEDDGDCSSRSRNREAVDQDAILDLLWQYILNDTVATLRAACEKLFSDRGVKDTKLAFVDKTQSLLKHKRATAIRILAKEMLAASLIH